MMKKILFFALFLCFSISGFSQVDFGVKAGLNFSNIHFNLKGASPEGAVGFNLGTFVDFELNRSFHLQPEILYSKEGIKDGSVNYLNVPVTLKWYFFEGIHVNAGPQLGILVDAEGGTDGLKTTNFSTVFGLGYETPGGFMIDTRYALGVANIVGEDAYVDSGMGYNIIGFSGWTRTFQIGIGYKF